MVNPILNLKLDKYSSFLMALKISTDINRMAIIDMIIKSDAWFLKRPKAAPVLRTRVICRISLIIGMLCPTVRFL